MADDTSATVAKALGMRVKKGRLSKRRGRYLLTVAGRRTDITTTALASPAALNRMVGDVYATYSGRGTVPVAIGTWPTPERATRCYWILCYVPAPDLMRRVQPYVRDALLKKMVDLKIVTPALAREARGA